jgi:hypothetical protein
MKIWIVKIGEPLEFDYPNVRLFRSSILAKKFSENGHSVTFIVDLFDHFRKLFRNPIDYNNTPIKYFFLKGIKYNYNFSLFRFINHFQVAFIFYKKKSLLEKPDFVVISFPTIFLSFFVAKYCVRHQIKFLVDVRDAWPSIFFKNKILKSAIMYYYRPILKYIFSNASHISGCAPFFKNYVNEYNINNAPFTYIPHTYPKIVNFPKSKFNFSFSTSKYLVYFGAISSQRKLDEFLNYFLKLNSDYIIYIAGEGDKFEDWSNRFSSSSIVWLGQIDLKFMSALAANASFGIAPYSLHEGYTDNIPNKIVEYISYGLPVITNINNSVINDLNSKFEFIYTYSDEDGLKSILENGFDTIFKKRIKDTFDFYFSEESFYEKFQNILINSLSK